jgi:hypothetical protein
MDIKTVLEDQDLNQLVYNALSFGTAVMLGAFVYFLIVFGGATLFGMASLRKFEKNEEL